MADDQRYRDWLTACGSLERVNEGRARRGEALEAYPPPPKGSTDALRPELNHYPNPPAVKP